MLQCYINRISWLLLPPLHWETETAPTKIWLGALKCESYFLLDADLPPIILPWHLYSKICNQWSACYVATGVKQWLTHTNKNRLRLFSMNECTTSKQTHHCCIQPLTRLSSSFTVDVHKCLMQHGNRVYISSVWIWLRRILLLGGLQSLQQLGNVFYWHRFSIIGYLCRLNNSSAATT